MHDLLKRNDLSHSGREIVMNSIMTVMTYIIYEYEGCWHSKGRICSLIHMGEGNFMLKIDHTQKHEFDPGSERTLAICLTHASRMWLASPSIHVGTEGQDEWPPPSACSLTQMICEWCAGRGNNYTKIGW